MMLYDGMDIGSFITYYKFRAHLTTLPTLVTSMVATLIYSLFVIDIDNKKWSG